MKKQTNKQTNKLWYPFHVSKVSIPRWWVRGRKRITSRHFENNVDCMVFKLTEYILIINLGHIFYLKLTILSSDMINTLL